MKCLMTAWHRHGAERAPDSGNPLRNPHDAEDI
jgi:hypothetical protein